MSEVMLTTKDNPYNPFVQYDEWEAYDAEMNHHTYSVLARITRTSHELTDELNRIEIDRAMDKLIELDFENKYIKVTKSNWSERSEDD